MIYYVSLEVEAKIKNKIDFLEIFSISQGDYLWSTLVADKSENNDVLDLKYCLEYLKNEAKVFSSSINSELIFKSEKKATQFSEKHSKRPRAIRNNDGSFKYPSG